MKAKEYLLVIAVSLIAGLALSVLSIIYIGQRTATMYDNDPNYTTHTVRRGFPITYINVTEGTACNGGTESSLRGVFESGTCDRDLDRSGISFIFNTLIWTILTYILLISVKSRKI